jgi:hypothetical protein
MSAHGQSSSGTVLTASGTQGRGLGAAERTAAACVVVLVALLGLIGAVNSFAAVAKAVESSFGDLAWTVPLGIDVGIAVFTALDLLFARMGMRMRLLRLVPWCLVAVTIYLNVAGEHDLIGAVAHGVLPLLWVIAVESGGHVVRTWAGLTSPTGKVRVRRLDRVRWSRWLLAPSSTLRLWRRMVLWETPSYSEALRRERDRVLARTELQDAWGALLWRWRAPRRARALYRLGELAPAGALPTSDAAPVRAAAPSSPVNAAKAPTSTTRRRSGSGNGAGKARGKTAQPVELVEVGRAVAAELAAEGRGLTRAALVERLRARGLPVSNARAGELLARLRQHTTTTTTEGVA